MRLFCAFLAACLLLQPVVAQGDPSDPIPFPWEDTIDAARVAELIPRYQVFVKKNPDYYYGYEVLVQLCFAAWRLENKDNKRRLAVSKIMLDTARGMVKLDPKRPEGYHWTGAAIGMVGLTNGVLNSLQLADDLRKAFEKSIAIDPGYMHGSALAQMARLYTMVPGFPLSIGDKEKALQYLLQAKKLDSNFTLTYLYLADLYWFFGREKEALEELAAMERIKPKTQVQYFLYHVNRQKARELRELIQSEADRNPFYDVLSDIQPGIVN